MAVVMKAKEAAERAYADVQEQADRWASVGVRPLMAAVWVEGDPATAHYVQAKRKIADRLGIGFRLHALPAHATEAAVVRLIDDLNADASVHGIMLELPLPSSMSAGRVAAAISPAKDVDGVTPRNRLATVTGDAGLYPATPQACIRLIKHYGYTLEGANVTLVGRGQTVGLPLFHLLQREQATVTVCHSRTPDIASHLAHADIVFAAVGRPRTITRDMVHARLAIVDAGINELDDGSIAGDVAPDVGDVVAALSPVPGGVGTLTTALLFGNLMQAIGMQRGEAFHA